MNSSHTVRYLRTSIASSIRYDGLLESDTVISQTIHVDDFHHETRCGLSVRHNLSTLTSQETLLELK